ncbi:hypothetical protein C5167_046347 [Papaver somniferum]|uniref:Uncharacterized protein n=1 Tax=Papaver somniferum TaxID=3469 RepID=A0A4Y7LFT8_PAPSO|nr:hypothetical protein C5167_046347 [Papaver somniferum]
MVIVAGGRCCGWNFDGAEGCSAKMELVCCGFARAGIGSHLLVVHEFWKELASSSGEVVDQLIGSRQ